MHACTQSSDGHLGPRDQGALLRAEATGATGAADLGGVKPIGHGAAVLGGAELVLGEALGQDPRHGLDRVPPWVAHDVAPVRARHLWCTT